jgi:hypothetical protein
MRFGRLVVVDDFDFIRITFFPAKTNSPLIVDPDAMLSGSIALQSLQPVSRRIH